MGLTKKVDFETAKLLKEKGFDEINNKLWHFNSSDCIEMVNKNSENFGFSAPTIAEVVMWLYEKHGIWVVVNIAIDNSWYFELYNLKDKRNAEIVVPNDISDNHNSPTEAYSEAITYTLKNLIK